MLLLKCESACVIEQSSPVTISCQWSCPVGPAILGALVAERHREMRVHMLRKVVVGKGGGAQPLCTYFMLIIYPNNNAITSKIILK